MGTLAGHRYVTRAEWGASPPTEPLVRIAMPTPRLWVHHSADDRQGAAAVRAHQAFHQGTRGWKDLAYAFLVGIDGTIFEGRGHEWVGGATEGDNSRSQAICLLGNFQTYGPSVDQWRALVDLVRHGRDAGWWTPTCGGHRDAPHAETACPGNHLYRRLPELRQAILLPPTPSEDDMALFEKREDFIAAVREAVGAEFTDVGDPTRTAVLELSRRGSLHGDDQLVIPDDFVQGGLVYFTDFKTKVSFQQGSERHNQIKADLAAQGLSTAARRVPAAVLDAIEDEVDEDPVEPGSTG
jgi:hypothetical protein